MKKLICLKCKRVISSVEISFCSICGTKLINDRRKDISREEMKYFKHDPIVDEKTNNNEFKW